ncbi:hypothetical protein CMQ_4778 [Grosmannia clavigera kw1407]|uniref:Uncharacterized protein n=1 Tax=Grosmannia clavigera (strain kw1407 / UAMH 11150) TaxID=655863 RepID=F0XTV1_GROCL|nr:uncharacterized protein CMQ_4778 [Grosmannia clavigera kw1407]EFW98926.1 hypothetical protein CMQ_4778 [Grosmannia clavigera kw1407]
MRLYAAGFNAWNQLQFRTWDKAESQDDTPDCEGSEPSDIYPFSCILESEKLGAIQPFLTFTTLTTAKGQLLAGAVPEPFNSGHDDYNYAEAMNGRVVVYDGAGSIYQYSSVADYYRRNESELQRTVFKRPSDIIQTVAYDTGFAALTSTGQVWTWGDGRFPECLCRSVTEESPADRPGCATCLEDLPTGPIVKIAAGGYVLTALTSGRDLYAWGGYPGRQPVLEGLTGDPVPIVVVMESEDSSDDADIDIVDVGVGEEHMIVLMADGTVCAIGSNSNGQLGLDPDQRAAASSWVRVPIPLLSDEHVVDVVAGPRSSFVLVDKKA